MKKRCIIAILVLVLCLLPLVTAAAADPAGFVYDEADLLSSAQEADLGEKLQGISQAYSTQIVVVTKPSTEGGDIDRYVETLYDTMGFGYGEDHDGVLLLICMDISEYRILTNGLGADAISPSAIDDIADIIAGELSDGAYYDATEAFADRCEYYLDGHINGFPFNYGMNLLIALTIGILAGVLVTKGLKGQLKSVRMQRAAQVYVKQDSMNIIQQ